MNDAITKETTLTVGLDLGDRYIQVCVLDEAGEIVEESRLPTKPAALKRRFSSGEPLRMVLEAGTHSPWVSRLLADLGHDVLVANPRKLRLIYQNESKSDRVDAEYLARVGRLDPSLLAPLRHRSAETQEDLALLRSRNALVRARTRLISHARGAVKSVGDRLPSSGAEAFATKAESFIPEKLRPALLPVLASIEELTQEIKALDETDREDGPGALPGDDSAHPGPGGGDPHCSVLHPHHRRSGPLSPGPSRRLLCGPAPSPGRLGLSFPATPDHQSRR